MERIIRSRIYVLGDNVDTDQIIPAGYLAISLSNPAERARYGGLAMIGVPATEAGLPSGNVRFADPETNRSPYGIVIAGKNFGCGSSREHAPIALAEAGVQAVIALSYARIFYRNAVDGGYFPPFECREDLTSDLRTGDEVILNCEKATLVHSESGSEYSLRDLGAAASIVNAGGLFAYARLQGLLRNSSS